MALNKRKFLVGVALASAAVLSTAALAQEPPDHAINVCPSASFYAGYNSASGPYGFKRTLYYGDEVGHTRGAHPVYNGWACSSRVSPPPPLVPTRGPAWACASDGRVCRQGRRRGHETPPACV